MFLLNAIYVSDSPTELRQLIQVEFLRRAWVFQFYQDGDEMIFTGVEVVIYHRANAFSSRLMTRMRGAVTKIRPLEGACKVHLTEGCDADKPHLITHVETTLATEADNPVVETIHAALEQKNC